MDPRRGARIQSGGVDVLRSLYLYLYVLFLQRLSEAVMLDHVYEIVMR
jgi:hypothetical protein